MFGFQFMGLHISHSIFVEFEKKKHIRTHTPNTRDKVKVLISTVSFS